MSTNADNPYTSVTVAAPAAARHLDVPRPMSSLPASLLPRLRPTAAARRFASWLALFALLVGALVPTLSRLAHPAPGDAWSTLCQAPGSTPADPAAPHELGDACALCLLAHTTPGLTGGSAGAVATIAYAPPEPVAAPAVVTGDVAVRAPGARGPPAAA